MTIRYAMSGDAGPLRALFAEVVAPLAIYNEAARAHELATFTTAHFATRIAADPHAVMVAEDASGLTGFAVTEDEHGPIWLEWYGVAARARGQGIGEGLLRFLIAQGAARGATRLWCDTRTANTASNALLVKLGFRQLCELKAHWHGQDYYLWELSPLPSAG